MAQGGNIAPWMLKQVQHDGFKLTSSLFSVNRSPVSRWVDVEGGSAVRLRALRRAQGYGDSSKSHHAFKPDPKTSPQNPALAASVGLTYS
jgi:hypothetical protein